MKKDNFHRARNSQWTLYALFCLTLTFFMPIQVLADNHADGNSYNVQKMTVTDDTIIREPATGLAAPFSELKDTNPKLDSALNQLIKAYKVVWIDRAKEFAAESGILMKEDLVQVVIELDSNPDFDALSGKATFLNYEIPSLRGKIEHHYKNLIQAYIPVDVLEKVASWPEVRLIRKPFKPNPMVISEGIRLVNADIWQASGFTGKGTKVGIVDVGFKNYNSLLGIELPRSVSTYFFTPYSLQTSVHGTAVAEIIHDMAPDADLFLTEPGTDAELGVAIEWLISHGVKVVNHSVNWNIANGPLDGTGSINSIVDSAFNKGITWVNSVGNNRFAHWSGGFSDLDGDSWLNFSGDNEVNELTIYPSQIDKPNTIGMNWNDTWGRSNTDYDLYVVTEGNVSNVVASSTRIQDGDDDPWESVTFYPQFGVSYGVAIKAKDPVSWSTPQAIADLGRQGTGAGLADLDVDADGNWHVVYANGDTGIEYRGPLGTQLIASGRGQNPSSPSIAIDADGNIHVTYAYGRSVAGTWNMALFYRENSSGSWSTPQVIADLGSQGTGAGLADLDVDADGNWHVVYDKAGPGIEYRNPFGSQLIAPVSGQSSPSIAIDADGNIHVTYAYGRSVAGTWNMALMYLNKLTKKIHISDLNQSGLEHNTPETSLLIPADNKNNIAVGAVAWDDPSTLKDYSSRGPTTDGRIKPDIVGPTDVSVSNLTYYPYGFEGTSASAPHVAGAASLVLEAWPNLTPFDVRALLENRAIDEGEPGKDNLFGSGLLYLDTPPENTQPGTDVEVSNPEAGTVITFAEITSGGNTVVTVTETGPPTPTEFKLVPAGTYYAIITTATYIGPINICINYDDFTLTSWQERNLKLRRYDEATDVWVDITTSLDTIDNIICGETDYLSFFGVMYQEIIRATVDIHPDTINLKSKGKYITCYIELPTGYEVNDIDIATVTIGRDTSYVSAETSPTEVGDFDSNGIPDLMVKFNRASVQWMLSSGYVQFTVSGSLKSGLYFEGSEVVNVIE